jgi:hypothetical protein
MLNKNARGGIKSNILTNQWEEIICYLMARK